MQRLVVRAVHRDQLLDTIGCECVHLGLEPGSAHRGHELLVGHLRTEHLFRRMPHRGEDDRAGVDHRAVEIEEYDRKTHETIVST